MRRLFVLLPMLVLASTAAMADGLNLNWREARVVKLAKPATSVVVGDPTVADVTLETPQTVVVFGKTPGETNLLVLSGDQELLLDWPVVVSPVSARHVSVLNAVGPDEAPTEVLYACGTERCARVLSPTDVELHQRRYGCVQVVCLDSGKHVQRRWGGRGRAGRRRQLMRAAWSWAGTIRRPAYAGGSLSD